MAILPLIPGYAVAYADARVPYYATPFSGCEHPQYGLTYLEAGTQSKAQRFVNTCIDAAAWGMIISSSAYRLLLDVIEGIVSCLSLHFLHR
jgi:hypothetical protein